MGDAAGYDYHDFSFRGLDWHLDWRTRSEDSPDAFLYFCMTSKTDEINDDTLQDGCNTSNVLPWPALKSRRH